MQLDALAIALRPRPMGEAADLGVALVQTHARALWRCYTPVWAGVLLLALATIEIAPWLPGLLIFWLKPWLDRTLLFVLSRAVFGETTLWADLWRARRSVFAGQWLATLSLARLSPWRAFTQPIGQLEGLRGKACRRRRAQLLASQRGSVAGLQFAYANLELVLILSVIALVAWFTPATGFGQVWRWLTDDSLLLGQASLALLYAGVVLALEPFYVAGGLAQYLNRRVELEAWDVEQALRHAFAR